MEINCKMTYRVPEELVSALGLNEDTAFETYFEDGAIHIHPLTDEELDEYESPNNAPDDLCDGICEECALDDCCPYDEEDDDECDENCENCRYYCRHCGHCSLDDETEDDE